MAYLESSIPTQEQWRTALITGVDPTTTSGGELGGGAQEATFAAPESTQSASMDQTPQTTPEGQGVAKGSVFGNVRDELPKSYESIRQLGEAFKTEAGPSRTWESIGGQGLLQGAIGPGLSQEQRTAGIATATPLLTASYTGPTGLDQAKGTELKSNLTQLGEYVSRLGTGGGLQASLQLTRPGMTRGQALMDARGLLQNPDYKRGVAEQGLEVGKALADYQAQESQAADFAKQRATEESDIASKAKTYLGEQETATKAPIEAEVARKNAEDAAALAKMQAAYATGQGLEAYAPDLKSPYADELAQAKSKWDEIWAKYPEVAQYKDIGRTVANHSSFLGGPGTGLYGTDIRDAYVTDPVTGRQRLITDYERGRIQLRQNELEKLFMPGGFGGMNDVPTGGEGEYADVLPMYFGEEYKPGAITPEMVSGIDEGMAASVGNTATDDQIAQLDAIHELLGTQNDVIRSSEPWRAATLLIDAKKYLDSENARMEAQKESLTKEQKSYWNNVRANIKAWNKKQKSEEWGPISQVLTAVGIDNPLT